MKLAIFRRTAAPATGARAEDVVAAMLRAMVRREPATPVVATIPGGAVGAWIEARDDVDTVIEPGGDGSFAIGDMLLLRPGDASALLDAVRERGEAAFPDLDGSFAAIVHDARARRTYVLTDRFTTRPLYVHDDGRTFAAASEAKALFAAPGIEPAEDPLAIHDLLNFGYLVGERTWFAGVSLVPDATAILLEPGRRAARRRYRGPLFEPGTLSERDGLEAVAAAFEKGCRDLGRRARRPAMLLSGGLDSRTISSFCARAGVPLTCYTFGRRRSDEATAAVGIAGALGYPVERCEVPPDLLPRHAAVAEWVCDGHVSLGDVHFLDHHVNHLGPEHGAFFDGWLGGVIGGAYYIRDEDLELRTTADLARSMQAFFDYLHPVPLEDSIYRPEFARRLRERAGESVREFLAGFGDLAPAELPVAKEAASLRFRDRRWQLFHNGVVAEPFGRGLRPYVLGDIVERFQALPLEARMHARFYQKLLLRHFPGVAAVTWTKTGRAIGRPSSPLVDAVRAWRRQAFYYLGRLSGGALNLHDRTKYNHYDQTFREHEPLRSYLSRTLGTTRERLHLRDGGLAILFEAERRGGRYFEILARLLQAELAARLFLDPDREAAREALLPEKVGSVRIRGGGAVVPVPLRHLFRKEIMGPAAAGDTAQAA